MQSHQAECSTILSYYPVMHRKNSQFARSPGLPGGPCYKQIHMLDPSVVTTLVQCDCDAAPPPSH